MNWKRNDDVIYLPTNEPARITRVVNEEIVYIRLVHDKAEIPALAEDLGEAFPEPEAEAVEAMTMQAIPEGLHFCFQYRMFGMSPETVFPVFLANGTGSEIGYDINFYTNDSDPQQLKGRVKPGGVELIHQLPFPLLHLNPVYEIDWSNLHSGNQIHSKDIQFKASQFFNRYGDIPFLQATGTMYPLQEPERKAAKKAAQPSLREYTRGQKAQATRTAVQPSGDIRARAEFNNVLDLHIESLAPGKAGMSKGDIFRMQLSAFDQFLDQAVRHKINQVFVLHGIGKGKLRDEINSRLIQDHRVQTFKNEYHPNFGYGATEIWLY